LCITKVVISQNLYQIVKESLNTYGKFESGSYQVKYKCKYFEDNDTSSISAKLIFKRDSITQPWGFAFTLLIGDDGTYLCDKKTLKYFNKRGELQTSDSVHKSRKYFHGNRINFLFYPMVFSYNDNTLSELIVNEKMKSRLLKSETVNGEMCWVIKAESPDLAELFNIYNILYLSKKSHLILKHIINFNMKTDSAKPVSQYEVYEFSKIIIDQK
jgi:hypothetical protein